MHGGDLRQRPRVSASPLPAEGLADCSRSFPCSPPLSPHLVPSPLLWIRERTIPCHLCTPTQDRTPGPGPTTHTVQTASSTSGELPPINDLEGNLFSLPSGQVWEARGKVSQRVTTVDMAPESSKLVMQTILLIASVPACKSGIQSVRLLSLPTPRIPSISL